YSTWNRCLPAVRGLVSTFHQCIAGSPFMFPSLCLSHLLQRLFSYLDRRFASLVRCL
ncbi:hypothetical protein HAX54_019083, partial [Datura stramonium]|nr:hypothetical protein [Datura stramonium]